jgi:enoyl-CoA hydratase/carnithine racemase
MKQPARIEFEYDNIKSYVVDNLAVIKISCNAFGTISNLDDANKILPWFDAVELDDSLKGVLAINEKDCLGEEAYEKFLSEITGRDISKEGNKEITKFEKSEVRAIEINTLVNLIRKVLQFKKIFIAAINGEIVTPFFGINLASDFRFGSEDMRILFSHVKYGIHPSGILPLMLPKYLNRQLATKYLLQGGEIRGDKAVELNLVNEILPSDNFEERCVQKSKEYLSCGINFIKSTKSLLNRNMKEFEEYVQIEANYTYK